MRGFTLSFFFLIFKKHCKKLLYAVKRSVYNKRGNADWQVHLLKSTAAVYKIKNNVTIKYIYLKYI